MKNTIPVILGFFGLIFSISAFSASDGCGINDCWARATDFAGENVCVVCEEGEIEVLDEADDSLCSTEIVCEERSREIFSYGFSNLPHNGGRPF